jgi:nucleoside-diphosphate-sugar epimerase
MLNIAIVGASSFLSTYIIDVLEKEKHKLTLFSRQKINEVHDFIKFDYPNSIPEFKHFLKFDIIIFTAASGVQNSNEYSIDEIYSLNSFLPISISNFLSQNNYKGKLITFGSYAEIGCNSQLKYYNETEVVLSNLKVHNHYSLSKRILSRFVNNNINCVLHYHVILPNIYGKNENKNRLIPYLINCLSNNNIIKLTSGDQVRQFLHVKDVTLFISKLCNSNIDKGIYNLSTNSYYLVKDVTNIIFNYFGKNKPNDYEKIERSDESMKVLLLDNTKSKNEGWVPKINLIDGILDYFN